MGVLLDALTTEPLVANDSDGRQSERLATEWSWDESHTTLRLKLRSDVFFHDGTRLTPELVAASLRESIAGPETYNLSSIKSVTASRENVLELHLAEPDSFLLPSLGSVSIHMAGRAEIGTGPFRLVSRKPLPQLEAFPRYFRGRPTIDLIDVVAYPTQRKAWSAMMRGEVDMLHEVSRDAVDFMEAETAVATYSFPRAYYIPLVFNLRHPAFHNVDVRRAINEAIDKEALVQDGLRTRGRPADSPIWPELWAYVPGQHAFRFNPDAAKLRLDNAGFPVRNNPSGMPSRFSFTCLVFAGDSRFERIALLLQKQLFDVGVDMRLQPVTQRELRLRAQKGDFDAFLFEMVSGKALNWVYAFWHSAAPGRGFIDTGYRAADDVLDRIRHARTDDEIRAATSDLSRVLHDDPPAAFLAWQAQTRAVSTRFDVKAEPNRDIMSSVWQWHLATTPMIANK